MKLIYIDESRKTEWENLVKKADYSGFMQSFFWSDFKRQTGWDTFKIGILNDKDELIAGAIILKFFFSKDKNFLFIPEGPILPYHDPELAEKCFHELMGEIDTIADLEGKQLTTHLRIEPRLTEVPEFFHKFTKSPYNMEPRNTLMVDLSMTEEEILKQMKPKGRYNIKIAEREGIEIKTDISDEGVQKFFNLYQKTVSRNTFSHKEKEYFEKLIKEIRENQNGNIYFAEYQDTPLSAALVLFFGNRATYFFGGSSEEHHEKMASYKLHWEIIRESKRKELLWYDFWGISPNAEKSNHDWEGFSTFKRKFGGTQFNFIGAYDFIYNSQLYANYLKESEEI